MLAAMRRSPSPYKVVGEAGSEPVLLSKKSLLLVWQGVDAIPNPTLEVFTDFGCPGPIDLSTRVCPGLQPLEPKGVL